MSNQDPEPQAAIRASRRSAAVGRYQSHRRRHVPAVPPLRQLVQHRLARLSRLPRQPPAAAVWSCGVNLTEHG